MRPAPDTLGAALTLAEGFESLGIRYFIGGSLASTYYGDPRTTQDADLVASIPVALTDRLLERLRAGFRFDEEFVRRAIRGRGQFQLEDLAAGVRIDVFVRAAEGFDGAQFEHARHVLVRRPDARVFMSSPENVVLQKLRWHRSGGGVSELQWRDVQSVLKALRGRLDVDYMRRWADELQLRETFERACEEAGWSDVAGP